MKQVTQQWLRSQVKQLPSVRTAYPPREGEADLLVRTWVGMSVRIYLLEGEPNLRALKRLLQENTRMYTASMLIAHHGLMPADHQRLIPDEWLQVLHELNSERIYTFTPGEPGIRQVHFDYMPDGIKREAWHGDEVPLEKLRVLDTSVQARALRGQYKMADFGPNLYWRTSEQRAERLSRRYRHGPQDFTWNRYDMGGAPGGATDEALHRAYRSELERNLAVLGLELDANRDEVKAAFRRLAREYHPDVSELDHDEANRRFRELNMAYEFIKAKKRWT